MRITIQKRVAEDRFQGLKKAYPIPPGGSVKSKRPDIIRPCIQKTLMRSVLHDLNDLPILQFQDVDAFGVIPHFDHLFESG